MKKVLSKILLLGLLVVVAFSLVGCGEEKEAENKKEKNDEKTISSDNNSTILSKKDKMIATQTMEEEGMKIEATIEVNFENDKAVSAISIMEFEDEETAQLMYSAMSSTEAAEVRIEGKKIIMEASEIDEEELTEMTREEVKEQLESEGFEIQ